MAARGQKVMATQHTREVAMKLVSSSVSESCM